MSGSASIFSSNSMEERPVRQQISSYDATPVHRRCIGVMTLL